MGLLTGEKNFGPRPRALVDIKNLEHKRSKKKKTIRLRANFLRYLRKHVAINMPLDPIF